MNTNLIGISGKIGSGKDTIGKIIQYLTLDDKVFSKTNADIIADLQHNGYVASKSDWEIKKYAFKLKQIASLMLGIPVEDFEKQEVKDRVLGEEWIRYGYANGFIQKNGETIMNNESYSKERYEEEFKTNWQTAYKSEMTVRMFLQLLGTEAMRNVVHPNAWVNALFADYKPTHPYPHEGKYAFIGNNCICCNSFIDAIDQFICDDCSNFANRPNWIITDVRFPNEAQAIKNRKGIIIRVNKYQSKYPSENISMEESNEWTNARIHYSEYALDNYQDFDYTIDNNGTIEELIEKVKEILIKKEII